MITNFEIQSAYRLYSRKYFSNALPKDLVVDFEKMHKKVYAMTKFYRHRPLFILISKELRTMPKVAEMCLLHEMVHVSLPTYNGHGAPFQKQMLRLARAGAFRQLW